MALRSLARRGSHTLSPNTTEYRPSRIAWIGAALLVYVALFWRLGGASFWDPDEAHYAQTSREMLVSGDWLAPFYNGAPFFDKPVYFHWLQASAMALFGPNEFAARIGPALASVVLIALTGWVGAQLAGRAVGWCAALLLAANPGLFGLTRYAILDAPFTVGLFGGVAVLSVAALGERRRLEYAGYALLALATLIKGPVAMVIAGLAFLVVIAVSREARRRFLALHWVQGVAIVIAATAPWLVYMLWRFEQAFIDGYFLNENLRLFAGSLYANQPGWTFYPGILLVGFLPWTGLWLGRAWDTVRAWRVDGAKPDLFDMLLWSWTITIVVFFSLSTFKLDHYVFPAAPALCLLAARACVEASAGSNPSRHAGARLGVFLVGPTLVVAGIAVGVLALTRLSLPASFLIVPAILVLLGAVATVRSIRAVPRAPASLAIGLAGIVVLYAGVLLWVVPALDAGKVMPAIAAWVRSNAQADDRLVTFQMGRWNSAYRFYVDRPVTMLDADHQAAEFFTDPRPALLLTTESRLPAFQQLGITLKVVYQQDGLWASSGQALWRRRGDPTVFVVARRVPAAP